METSVPCAICGETGTGNVTLGGHAICPDCQHLLDDPAHRVLTVGNTGDAMPEDNSKL